jgi:hypothetical protein
MRKILILIPLLALSCKKEETTVKECNCYQQNEHLGAGGVWTITSTTTPQPDLCSKETGQYMETSMLDRYIIKCD